MVVREELPSGLKIILRCETGSIRYGYDTGAKDRDWFILTPDMDEAIQVGLEDYFMCSVNKFRHFLYHPIIMGAIVGNCTGHDRLCTFMADHRLDLIYSSPRRTAGFGLDYIAEGERYKYNAPIKAGLRTAYILSHMADEREEPFLLSDEEKAVLIRARTGGVWPEERAEIYRLTICPENLDKLRRMPENTKVRNELLTLLDEICKEGTQ